LTEHQMNMAFREVFGDAKPTLPLQSGGNIVCGNATRLNWETVCPKTPDHETYILGNPPYLGGKLQSVTQKNDLEFVAKKINNFKNLDYIACWFIKAANYIDGCESEFAFVSTNSICQGEQVDLLWNFIFNQKLEIAFAHQSFKWTNNAKGNAGIICIVVGIRNSSKKKRLLFNDDVAREVENINPYLSPNKNIIVKKQASRKSKFPEIFFGSMPRDSGHLILTEEDKSSLIKKHPEAKKFILKYLGSQEFIRGQSRYCLWIEDDYLSEAATIPEIMRRIDLVKKSRLESNAGSTQEYANKPYRFVQISYQRKPSIIIPSVSSERRPYIPIGFVDSDTVISNLAFAIYEPETYIFAAISSRMHMTWVRAVAGRLKTDYRYSSTLW